MVRQHLQLNGHEFEQTLGDSKGQRSLTYGSPQGRRVRQDLATEQQQIAEYQTPRDSGVHMCLHKFAFDILL